MKLLFTILFSFFFISGAFSQTRNVLVGTNNTVVQPTNFWSVDASNARTGLGLGTAATNPASAFQPSSSVLSNLASSNAVNLTNLRATNIVGLIPASNVPAITLTNVNGTLAIASGGTGATNAATARINLELGATNNVAFGSAVFNGGISINGNEIAWESGILFDLETKRIYDVWVFESAPTFANAAGTRTNLGLGATNNVRFNSIELFQSGETTNSITYWIDGLSFVTGGVEYFATDAAEGGTIRFEKPITMLNSTNRATTRTNLGLGWVALTNTSVSGFNAALYGANTNPVLVNSNGSVVSPTNFWQIAPIGTIVQNFTPFANATNNVTNARTIYAYSLAISTVNVTNVITLPTNTSTFNGDNVTVIHNGPTSSVTSVKQLGASTNLVDISTTDGAVKFIYENNTWRFYHNISFTESIKFVDGNVELNKATSRTNLELGFTALTNTNISSFQRAIFSTNTTPSAGANLGDAKAWLEISVVTNNVTNSFRIPVFQ